MIAYLIKTGMKIIMSPARDNRQAWMHMQKGEATKLGQQYILILFFFFFFSLSKAQPILFILFCFIFYRCSSSWKILAQASDFKERKSKFISSRRD